MKNTQDRNWILDKCEQRLTGDFNQTYASLIVDVAKNSPASTIGLENGDYLVSVNGVAASSTDFMKAIVQSNDNIRYQFYSRAKHSYVNVVAVKIPLGIVTESSSLGIIEKLRKENFTGWSSLEVLWKRRAWDMLLEASEIVSSNSLGSRLVRLFYSDFGKSAEVLFKGAAIYELGEREAGIELVTWFIDRKLQDHESSLHAIAYYYVAKWAEFNGDNEGCKSWLAEANRSNGGQFERIAQEVHLKRYELPSTRYRWVGKLFPENYVLNILGGSDRISLNRTLDSMRADELLPICVMPAYRGNGPYNEAMLCYRAIYTHISSRIRPMHVILDDTEKRTDRLWWYENEQIAIDAGIPISLLHDSERTVANRLELEFSPVFYLLTNNGEVRYEGPLNQSFDYWSSLNPIKP